MKVAIHIERLVVDGLPITSAQGTRLRGTVEHELTRLIAAGGLPGVGQSGAMARADAGAIRFKPRDNADALGKRIAQAAYHGIGGGNPKSQRRKP